jgi:hypothetical protein
MGELFDGNLLARVLLTVTVLGYGFIPILADFNPTHATNPMWTPHARFHVVWQVLSYVGVGLLSLALIWAPGPLPAARLYLAAALSAAIYVAFFATLGSMKLFGGKEYDSNGGRVAHVVGVRLEGEAEHRDRLAAHRFAAAALRPPCAPSRACARRSPRRRPRRCAAGRPSCAVLISASVSLGKHEPP